jgi:hypothetical protein
MSGAASQWVCQLACSLRFLFSSNSRRTTMSIQLMRLFQRAWPDLTQEERDMHIAWDHEQALIDEDERWQLEQEQNA